MADGNIPILQGKNVILREPRPEDKKARLGYGRNKEFREMVGADYRVVPPLTEEQVEDWYREICKEPFGWIIEYENICIGSARLRGWDSHDRKANYSIGIFSPEYWGKDLGTEATRLVLDYAFSELRLHRVGLRVLSYNKRAISCYKKCGFMEEGVERECALIAGKWESDMIMGILSHEFIGE